MSFNCNIKFKPKVSVGSHAMIDGNPKKRPKLNRKKGTAARSQKSIHTPSSHAVNSQSSIWANEDFINCLGSANFPNQCDMAHFDDKSSDKSTSPEELATIATDNKLDTKSKMQQNMFITAYNASNDEDYSDEECDIDTIDCQEHGIDNNMVMFDEHLPADICIALNEAIKSSEYADFVTTEDNIKYHELLLYSEESIFKIDDDNFIFVKYDEDKDTLIPDQFVSTQFSNETWMCDKRCRDFCRDKWCGSSEHQQMPLCIHAIFAHLIVHSIMYGYLHQQSS